MEGYFIAVHAFHFAGKTQHVLPPGNRGDGIGCARAAQGEGEGRSQGDAVEISGIQAKQMAYEQMNTDSAPTIPFDTRVDVVGLAPFARYNLAAVFTGDSRYVAIFVQLTAVD